MTLNVTEMSQLVSLLRAENHKGIALLISDILDRHVREARQEISLDLADAATRTLSKLTGSPVTTGATRTLDTVFQVSETHPALVFYSVNLQVNNQSSSVQLLTGADNPPVVPNAAPLLALTVLLGLVSIQGEVGQLVVGFIDAGHYAKLTSSGTGTPTITNCLELVFQ